MEHDLRWRPQQQSISHNTGKPRSERLRLQRVQAGEQGTGCCWRSHLHLSEGPTKYIGNIFFTCAPTTRRILWVMCNNNNNKKQHASDKSRSYNTKYDRTGANLSSAEYAYYVEHMHRSRQIFYRKAYLGGGEILLVTLITSASTFQLQRRPVPRLDRYTDLNWFNPIGRTLVHAQAAYCHITAACLTGWAQLLMVNAFGLKWLTAAMILLWSQDKT